MSILSVIVALGLVGVVLYLINTYLPMEPGIKKLLNITVVCILIIWLLRALGLIGPLADIRL